jgi:hypothetical protein
VVLYVKQSASFQKIFLDISEILWWRAWYCRHAKSFFIGTRAHCESWGGHSVVNTTVGSLL